MLAVAAPVYTENEQGEMRPSEQIEESNLLSTFCVNANLQSRKNLPCLSMFLQDSTTSTWIYSFMHAAGSIH